MGYEDERGGGDRDRDRARRDEGGDRDRRRDDGGDRGGRDERKEKDRGERKEGKEDRGGKEERGERKEKKKKRSASSESAERSREREKRRRKQQQQYVNKNRKPEAGGAAPGAGQSMFWDGFQWVPRADTGGASDDVNANRKNRRLYLGNLPYHLGVTEDSFSKQLYETMRDRGLCNDPNQNPVLHVWFARDKGANYGFCEVASIEETDRALQLDGILVLGVPVSIKRPNDSMNPVGMIGGVPVGMTATPGAGPMLALPAVQVNATSPIIQINEILKVDDKTTKDDYTDVLEDMSEGCGAHAKVLGVLIIRPEHAQGRPGLKPGDVYLKCATTDDATKVMRAMGHRKYDSRQINMTSFEESKFNAELKPLM